MSQRKYENFIFLNINELNEKMNKEFINYKIINIIKEHNEEIGDYLVAWIEKI